MKVTGCFRSLRTAHTGALVLGGALALAAMPAQARLNPPATVGPMSGGFFRGVPVRAASEAQVSESEGVAANCYPLHQVVRDRLGATFVRTVQVCE